MDDGITEYAINSLNTKKAGSKTLTVKRACDGLNKIPPDTLPNMLSSPPGMCLSPTTFSRTPGSAVALGGGISGLAGGFKCAACARIPDLHPNE